ncbi:MAG: hypothetical protein Q4D26_07830 [Clostridia bacterium]|nr:hypothetical protein [Clostridia bacterium]
MDDDRLISMFADMVKGSEEGTGKLLLEKSVDKRYIINRLFISIIIVLINMFIFKMSMVVFVISLLVSFFVLYCCWENIFCFWSNKTSIKVYENGIEVSTHIDSKKYKSYYEITNVEIHPYHCIEINAHYYEGSVFYLEDENEVYDLILERIRIKTGRVKAN